MPVPETTTTSGLESPSCVTVMFPTSVLSSVGEYVTVVALFPKCSSRAVETENLGLSLDIDAVNSDPPSLVIAKLALLEPVINVDQSKFHQLIRML